MSAPDADRLVVEGHGGLLEGVRKVLLPGATLVIGRSRSCHLSLRGTPAFARLPHPLEMLRSGPFRRVSRVHCEIAYRPDGAAEVRDLSRNGTFVGGRRLERSCELRPGDSPLRVVLVDPAHGELRVGFQPQLSRAARDG